MKKTTSILILLCLLVLTVPSGAESTAVPQETARPTGYGALLSDMLEAYEAQQRIEQDLEALPDDEIAQAVAEHWKQVYLDPDYRLYLFGQDDPALLPVTGKHAFIVLGYELKDGEMTDELKGRCDAAAAAALAFPDSVLVCSGGATGQNNPQQHTEAGLMKDYLVNQHGIAPERVYTDERAMTTAENAVNTFVILQDLGIETMTIVTSSYHMRWGQVLYNALAAQYLQQYGYRAELIANFCYDTEPENPAYLQDARIAIRQLAGILALPPEEQALLPGGGREH